MSRSSRSDIPVAESYRLVEDNRETFELVYEL